jgi:hypothetical protein
VGHSGLRGFTAGTIVTQPGLGRHGLAAGGPSFAALAERGVTEVALPAGEVCL